MIVIMGAAGAGKSVQGKFLADKLGCPWISIGELLRANVDEGLKQRMLAGDLLDDREIFKVLGEALTKLPTPDSQCILDGFLRTTTQAHWLVDEMRDKLVAITGIVHLSIPHEVALERLLKRGRQDDHESAIAARFKDYDTNILPVVEYLKSQGLHVHDINGEGSVEQVNERIVGALEL